MSLPSPSLSILSLSGFSLSALSLSGLSLSVLSFSGLSLSVLSLCSLYLLSLLLSKSVLASPLWCLLHPPLFMYILLKPLRSLEQNVLSALRRRADSSEMTGFSPSRYPDSVTIIPDHVEGNHRLFHNDSYTTTPRLPRASELGC